MLWGVSDLEVMVHAPVPAGQHEVVASWGWPMELPSWSWDAPAATNLSVNVYSTHAFVQLLVNGKPLAGPKVPVSASTQYGNFDVLFGLISRVSWRYTTPFLGVIPPRTRCGV